MLDLKYHRSVTTSEEIMEFFVIIVNDWENHQVKHLRGKLYIGWIDPNTTKEETTSHKVPPKLPQIQQLKAVPFCYFTIP